MRVENTNKANKEDTGKTEPAKGFLSSSPVSSPLFTTKEAEMKEKGTHSFNIEDVFKYGSIEKALIMKEIKSIAVYKLRNGGDGWVYYSRVALAEKFPYMKASSIKRWMLELEKDGWLKAVIKNKAKYDRTKSYFPTELKGVETKKFPSIGQNDQSIGQNDQTIPPLTTPPTDNKYIYSEDSLEYKLASLLYRHILKRNPGHKAPNWGVWCKDMDKLLRIDKRQPAQVEKVINWCQKDSFWQDNILSPRKLRQQYDRLVLKMRKEMVKYG